MILMVRLFADCDRDRIYVGHSRMIFLVEFYFVPYEIKIDLAAHFGNIFKPFVFGRYFAMAKPWSVLPCARDMAANTAVDPFSD